ncbi:hypothetical protein OAF54_02805 [bacterium]|nr:hypothetical protein [bacterium]
MTSKEDREKRTRSANRILKRLACLDSEVLSIVSNLSPKDALTELMSFFGELSGAAQAHVDSFTYEEYEE